MLSWHTHTLLSCKSAVSQMLLLFTVLSHVEMLPKADMLRRLCTAACKAEVSLEICTLVSKLKNKCIWKPMFHPPSMFTIYQIHDIQKGLLTWILRFLTYNLNTVLFHVSWVICELGEMSLSLIFSYYSWNTSGSLTLPLPGWSWRQQWWFFHCCFLVGSFRFFCPLLISIR